MSEYVIMPKEDYKAACNAIRLKTGKTGLIKSGDMEAQIGSITGGGDALPSDVHAVTFMNGDTVLWVRHVADGDNCADVLTKGLIETPTKESTAQYDYTYNGWGASDGGAVDATILQNITEDKTVYATYSKATRKYTITFLDDDGTVLGTKEVAYGSMPSYTATKEGYLLTGWTPELAKVTGEAEYTAVWGTVLVVIPEQTISMTVNPPGYGQYVGTVPASGVALTAGATYKVVFDGTEYTATYYSYGTYYAYYKTSSAAAEYKSVYGLGSPFQYKYYFNSSGKLCTLQNVKPQQSTGSTGAISDNGLPFYIRYTGTSAGELFVYSNNVGSHTIYVCQEVT